MKVLLDAEHDLCMIGESMADADRFRETFERAAEVYAAQNNMEIEVVHGSYHIPPPEFEPEPEDLRIWQEIHNLVAGSDGNYWVVGVDDPVT